MPRGTWGLDSKSLSAEKEEVVEGTAAGGATRCCDGANCAVKPNEDKDVCASTKGGGAGGRRCTAMGGVKIVVDRGTNAPTGPTCCASIIAGAGDATSADEAACPSIDGFVLLVPP